MAVESPVAASRAMTPVEGRSNYLDENAGSLDSAGRRLALAEDSGVPLGERVRVLADVGRFLDEFFQLTAAQGEDVRERVRQLLVRQRDTLHQVRVRLGETGVGLCRWGELDDDDRHAAAAIFRDLVVPVLAPLVVEPGSPVPPPANLSLNVVAAIRDAGGRRRLGVVEVPPVVGRFMAVGSRRRGGGGPVVPVEQVVAANLGILFPAEAIEPAGVFRVTRQAGVVAAPDVDDMLASVERQLRLERHRRAVRLEVDSSTPDDVVERLMRDFDLAPGRVYTADGMMGLADLSLLPLGDRPSVPRPRPSARRAPDMFRTLEDGAVLAHFPYDSYTDSVVALLDQASADPALLGIKQALYRPTPDGATVRALVRAAERGAHVVAVVELAARLDESDSVASARALERAGAHVVYGLVGLRTHCPLTLVIRAGDDRVSRYGVVGTGLHHPVRRPEGMALLTADPEITGDLTELFNYLTGYSRPARFRKLLVGPGHLRSRLLELIRRETAAGPAGHITLKVYRLVDREVVDALYRASQRGVRIDLVVSGACGLRPGVAGLSEGVRVVATAGRHFETSRLFAFGSGESSSVFLSSGDLALAHVDRQVDVAAPVDTPALRARLRATLDALMRFPAWEMDADGVWHRRGPGADGALRQLAGLGGSTGRRES